LKISGKTPILKDWTFIQGSTSFMYRRLFALLLVSFLFTAPAFAGFDEGKQAYDKARWMEAIINLRPAVEAGDARAMILLANMYMEGHGVGQDSKEAFGLYHEAALKNNTDGMVAVATLYQTGNGVPVNTPLAVGWFERAARMGNMDAALIYAIHMYQGSKGKDYDIKPNHEASYRWFRIIAAHSQNKKQAHAAEMSAERLSKKLTHDEIVQGDREVANWKPEMPEEIGPDPEQKFIADFNAKHPKEEEKKPDEKKDVTAPDKKSGTKKPTGTSLK
jgi:TPR repeat protein